MPQLVSDAGSQARGPPWNAVSLQEGSWKGEEPGMELSAHPQGQLCPRPDVWGPTEHQSTDQPRPPQACPSQSQAPRATQGQQCGGTKHTRSRPHGCNYSPASSGHEILLQDGLRAKPVWNLSPAQYTGLGQCAELGGHERCNLMTPLAATSRRIPLRAVEPNPRSSNR